MGRLLSTAPTSLPLHNHLGNWGILVIRLPLFAGFAGVAVGLTGLEDLG